MLETHQRHRRLMPPEVNTWGKYEVTDGVNLSQMQRSVTLSQVCPPSCPGEAMQTLGLCAESEASKPVRADGLLSSWRNTQMVRTDITWSVNAYWHSMIQKNCGERLKISTDGGAVSASRATSAGARRLWGKKLLLLHLGGTTYVAFSPLQI